MQLGEMQLCMVWETLWMQVTAYNHAHLHNADVQLNVMTTKTHGYTSNMQACQEVYGESYKVTQQMSDREEEGLQDMAKWKYMQMWERVERSWEEGRGDIQREQNGGLVRLGR